MKAHIEKLFVELEDTKATAEWSDGQKTFLDLRNYNVLNPQQLREVMTNNRYPPTDRPRYTGEAKFINTIGHQPFIEYRPSVNRHFVVFPDLDIELAPAFELRLTAQEIAAHSYCGTPFFERIPSVKYRTPYPRPNRPAPKLGSIFDFEVKTWDYDD